MKIVKIRKNWPPYNLGYRYALRFNTCWSAFKLEEALRKNNPGSEFNDWGHHYGKRRLMTQLIDKDHGGRLVTRKYVAPYYVCFKTKQMITYAMLLQVNQNEPS